MRASGQQGARWAGGGHLGRPAMVDGSIGWARFPVSQQPVARITRAYDQSDDRGRAVKEGAPTGDGGSRRRAYIRTLLLCSASYNVMSLSLSGRGRTCPTHATCCSDGRRTRIAQRLVLVAFWYLLPTGSADLVDPTALFPFDWR